MDARTKLLQRKECKIRISENTPQNFKGYRIFFEGANLVKFTIGACRALVTRVGFDITPPDKNWEQIPDLILEQLGQINLDAASPYTITLGRPLLETVSSRLQEYYKRKEETGIYSLFSLSASVGPVELTINPIFEPILDEVVPTGK